MRKVKFIAGTCGSVLLFILYILNQRYKSRVLSHVKHDDSVSAKTRMISQDDTVNGTCTSKENITFIKIHKTGSTTVQNVLLRYGDSNNLTFVLPRDKIILGYPQPFKRKFMLEMPDGKYNILCNHARFNNDEMTQLMPLNTVYITLIRDPVTQYESYFTYFGIGSACKIRSTTGSSLKTFFNDPKKCYRKTKRNFMLFDLGMDEQLSGNMKEIDKMISFIDKKFSLVMIMEYMEESVILMKDLLCWNLEDVTYFALNSRKEQSKHHIDEETRRRILEWNSGDVKLYQHFNSTLWQKIEKYGRSRMARDVKLLREMNKELTERCLQSADDKERGTEYHVYKPPGVVMDNQVLKKNAEKDCERRVLPERIFTALLKKKQFPQEFANLVVS
ncbi:galactosylceramide sulfotransferase-like [Ptychodera flava]|uniref:galactosylceramide sulfotransferase-like n=1 Tax=Ptychodera flava TaxID=63121 RepID=UPI003969EAF4